MARSCPSRSQPELVHREHLRLGEVRAGTEQAASQASFRTWASSKVEGALHMNVGSGAQIQQLLFSGAANAKDPKQALELQRTFKVCSLACVFASRCGTS